MADSQCHPDDREVVSGCACRAGAAYQDPAHRNIGAGDGAVGHLPYGGLPLFPGASVASKDRVDECADRPVQCLARGGQRAHAQRQYRSCRGQQGQGGVYRSVPDDVFELYRQARLLPPQRAPQALGGQDRRAETGECLVRDDDRRAERVLRDVRQCLPATLSPLRRGVQRAAQTRLAHRVEEGGAAQYRAAHIRIDPLGHQRLVAHSLAAQILGQYHI